MVWTLKESEHIHQSTSEYFCYNQPLVQLSQRGTYQSADAWCLHGVQETNVETKKYCPHCKTRSEVPKAPSINPIR